MQNINPSLSFCSNKQRAIIKNNGTPSAISFQANDATDRYVKNKSEEKEIDNSKKKKIAKYALIGSSVLVIAGTIIGGKFIPKDALKEFFKKFAKQEANGKETCNRLLDKSKKICESTLNCAANFNSTKDAYLKKIYYPDLSKHPKFLSKHPKLTKIWDGARSAIGKPLAWLDKTSSDIYTKAANKTVKSKFHKAEKMLKKSDGIIENIIKSIPEEKLGQKVTIDGVTKSAREWTSDIYNLQKTRNTSFAKEFGDDAIDNIFAKLKENFKNMPEDFRQNMERGIEKKDKGIIKKIFKKFKNSFMISDIVQPEKEKFAEAIGKKANNFENSDIKLNSLVENLLSKGIAKDSVSEIKYHRIRGRAKTIFAKSTNILKEDAFDKMRDIGVGCAPTDIMFTDLGGLLGLGIYTAQAKTKEERTSVMLTTAVPLGLGMGGVAYSAVTMKSGIKGLLIGGAISIFSSIVGKSLDKIYRKKHNMENDKPSILTLKIPQPIEDTTIAKGVDKVVTTIAE